MTTAIGLPAAQVRWVPGIDPTSVSRHDRTNWYGRALAVDSASSAKHVIRLAVSQLSATERDAIRGLMPGCERQTEANAGSSSPMMWSVLAEPDQHVVSHMGILYRVIRVGDVMVPVGALSTVTTVAAARGRGYARAVVASATAFVGVWLWAPFAMVLCAADA